MRVRCVAIMDILNKYVELDNVRSGVVSGNVLSLYDGKCILQCRDKGVVVKMSMGVRNALMEWEKWKIFSMLEMIFLVATTISSLQGIYQRARHARFAHLGPLNHLHDPALMAIAIEPPNTHA